MKWWHRKIRTDWRDVVMNERCIRRLELRQEALILINKEIGLTRDELVELYWINQRLAREGSR